MVRPTDRSIWEELAPLAAAAGVGISAAMWWPTDPPVKGLQLKQPTIVIKVEQREKAVTHGKPLLVADGGQ
ncbi:hypothetical protein [Corynebacterium ulcerans]|uniref:hypothetical protein n=1 Tax=Corynebacterium ulcerans TaxID=65058 RepID=UPI0021636A30|nr:hypothetical protein [Corynebacterium ulcerans]